MITAALQQRMLVLAMGESLANAHSAPVVPPPKPVRPISHMVSWEEVQDQKECSVCLNRFQYQEDGVVEIGCGHIFHAACLGPWIADHDTCPMCRAFVGVNEA
jgi:hypothetical protein